MSPFQLFRNALRASIRDAATVCLSLYKMMLPLIVIIKILSEFDLISYVALPLAPLMSLMGLPEDLGIAWAAGMIVNLYSALIVFAAILPGLEPMSVAQVSIFALILLYAHSLPIEGRIAQQCGLSFFGQFAFRIVIALISGIGLHMVFSATGWFAEPATILFTNKNPDPTLAQWAFGEFKNFVMIFLIIVVLLMVQRGIDHFNITRWLEMVLKPLLSLVDVSSKAASTIMIGMSMGIIYGSGLIIRAAHDGTLSRKDIFGAVTLMGVAHAIIEDTVLMMLIGADWTVVLVLRSLIAIVGTALVVRTRGRISPIAEAA